MGTPFSNSTTSLAAADAVSASGAARTQKDRILAALRGAVGGATHPMLSEATGIGIRQTATRVRQLVLEGKAMDSGETIRGQSGHEQILWVACSKPPQEPRKQTHGRIAAALNREREAIAAKIEADAEYNGWHSDQARATLRGAAAMVRARISSTTCKESVQSRTLDTTG